MAASCAALVGCGGGGGSSSSAGSSSAGGDGTTPVTPSTCTAPAIGTQPQATTVAAGASATFSVAASGGGSLGYQWRRDGVVITGATAASYTVAAAAADDGASFSVQVSACGSTVDSQSVRLSVTSAVPAPTVAQRLWLAPYNGAAVRADGSVLVWGFDRDAQLGNGTPLTGTVARTMALNAAAVWGSYAHLVVLGRDAKLYGWGTNTFGQLGGTSPVAANYETVVTPRELTGVSNVVDALAVNLYTLAVRSDGTVWHWPGVRTAITGNRDSYTVAPAQVPGLTGVVRLSRGRPSGGVELVTAVRTDGTVWEITLPDYTTLPGALTARVTQVANLSAVAQVDCQGSDTMCAALKTDGSVVTWSPGELPQVAVGLANVSGLAISTGSKLYAVRSDGTVWSYVLPGSGGAGSAPSQVAGLSGALDIVSNGDTHMVRLADGTLWGWGSNFLYGLLADGTTTDRETPVQAVGLQLN